MPHDIVVITTAQLTSKELELKLDTCSNSSGGMLGLMKMITSSSGPGWKRSLTYAYQSTTLLH